MERKYQVVTFVVELLCDFCEGKMQGTGITFPTNPMQYEYVCPNCSMLAPVLTKEHFPYIKYEEVNPAGVLY